MNIILGSMYSEVASITDEELHLTNIACTIKQKRYFRRPGELHPQSYEKTIRYFNGSKFPTGLLHRIITQGVSIDVVGRTKQPSTQHITFNLILPKQLVDTTDYSFQEKAVATAIEKVRGILWYPTGSGKTIIMAKIIHKLSVPALIMVPNKVLLWQTYIKMCEYFGNDAVGMFGDGKKKDLIKPILVATQQSLYSLMLKDKARFDSIVVTYGVLFVDECHHITSVGPKKNKTSVAGNTWWKVAINIPCRFRYGVTATVDDNDYNRFMLESVTYGVISKISVEKLIRRNVLCPMNITMVEVPATPCRVWKSIYSKKGECLEDGAYEINILSKQRMQLVCDIAEHLYRKGKTVLVLVDLIKRQGEILQDMMQVPSVFLCGLDNHDERKIGIDAFVNERKVLIATIVKEGFDVPKIDALVIAGGGKSEKALIQKLGRGRRVYPGKAITEVWDIYDDDGASKYGPRMCSSHSISRRLVYESMKKDVFRIITATEFYKEVRNVHS